MLKTESECDLSDKINVSCS
uniref:Uncharacterized protein n=1 Tax=Arundo donax TaxID=35708 RepID=A0A0A8YUI8_ARUDO